MTGKKSWETLFICLALCVLVFTPVLAPAGIKTTKHNLSVSGPGSVKAVEETQICIFCHTPHNASPSYPLWNHELSAVTNYIPYFSNTLQSYDTPAAAPAVDGVSKLCLSCHDGTVAVGSITSKYSEIIMEITACVDSSGRLLEGIGCSGYIGTDLSGGHPISIIFDDVLAGRRNNHVPPLMNLNYPSTINDRDVKLYPTHGGLGVQCASCHNPHGTKADWPPFWRKSSHDEVCLVCHQETPPEDIAW